MTSVQHVALAILVGYPNCFCVTRGYVSISRGIQRGVLNFFYYQSFLEDIQKFENGCQPKLSNSDAFSVVS